MDLRPLASVMQRSIIHKASASVGWRVVAVLGHKAQTPKDYQIHRGIHSTSHISGFLMKMGCEKRELECINTLFSMETITQYYKTN